MTVIKLKNKIKIVQLNSMWSCYYNTIVTSPSIVYEKMFRHISVKHINVFRHGKY